MAKINRLNISPVTHEGAKASVISDAMQLRRSMMSCMLWENQFYEDGMEISDRIALLVPRVEAAEVASIAIEAREEMKLRHVPLFIVREMARFKSHRHLVAVTLARIIRRPDEISEFMAIYWKDGKCSVSSQVKKGLAAAFNKFDEYQLAKYDRKNAAVRLRDVLFMVHPKPDGEIRAASWKKLAAKTLEPPHTWETELSAGKDPKIVWQQMLQNSSLGVMALIRNLRNMQDAGVDSELIKSALNKANPDDVLPFRFLAAARTSSGFDFELERLMFKCLENMNKFSGKNILLVDVSASMYNELSSHSWMTRLDAACGLAVMFRELCEDLKIFSFSEHIKQIDGERGFALSSSLSRSQDGSSTLLGKAVDFVNANFVYDRIVVVTDEQSADNLPEPAANGYIINVASAKRGIGYDRWFHIDGWSYSVFKYIDLMEKNFNE